MTIKLVLLVALVAFTNLAQAHIFLVSPYVWGTKTLTAGGVDMEAPTQNVVMKGQNPLTHGATANDRKDTSASLSLQPGGTFELFTGCQEEMSLTQTVSCKAVPDSAHTIGKTGDKEVISGCSMSISYKVDKKPEAEDFVVFSVNHECVSQYNRKTIWDVPSDLPSGPAYCLWNWTPDSSQSAPESFMNIMTCDVKGNNVGTLAPQTKATRPLIFNVPSISISVGNSNMETYPSIKKLFPAGAQKLNFVAGSGPVAGAAGNSTAASSPSSVSAGVNDPQESDDDDDDDSEQSSSQLFSNTSNSSNNSAPQATSVGPTNAGGDQSNHGDGRPQVTVTVTVVEPVGKKEVAANTNRSMCFRRKKRSPD